MIIVSTGIVSLLNAGVVNQKSQDLRSEVDNLSFILEDMSRNLRTGSNYRCILDPTDFTDSAKIVVPKSSPGGAVCRGIAFEYSDGDKSNSNDQWVYYIDNNGVIQKSTQGPYTDPSFTPGNFVALTSNEVNLSTIDPVYGKRISGFTIVGAETAAMPDPVQPWLFNQQQPFVIIRVAGTITSKNVITPFSLQTSVSQRLVDI